MEPLRVFEGFRFDEVDESWLNSVWDGEFLTFKEVPGDFSDFVNSEDMNVLLKDCSEIVKDWIAEGETDLDVTPIRTEVSWQTLVLLGVNPRCLLPVLGFMISNGQSFDACEDDRQICLRSASLYFTLLSVPGSNAFQVFHQNLYHLALKTFKLSRRLVQRSKNNSATVDSADLSYSDDENLIFSEKLTLNKGLNSLMFDVTVMLRGFHFRDRPQSLEITVHELLQVTRLSKDVIAFDLNSKVNNATVASLAYNAYAALHLLCNSDHGPVHVTIRLLARYILPNLISNQDELLPKELYAVRESMTRFFEKLVRAHKQEARLGITILIQHLMVKCPERAEARLRLAAVILRLINSCEEKVYLEAVGDLVALAHNTKISLRIFAQEIIAKFLIDTFHNGNVAQHVDPLNLKIKKLFIATVLSRCMDSSSLVRGKAMAIIADYTDPKNNVALITIREVFECSNPDKPFPTVDILQQAVSEDTDPLPGFNIIVQMLIARVNDERAFVRRSALQTLANLVHLFSGLLNSLTPALGLHCRDPALIVRRYSIQVFTKLLEKFPDQPLLAHEWVKHALPQIFDVEVKVQEKVLESLQQLIFDNVTYFLNNNERPTADLPWVILNQITEQKMRKHLAKACALWVKTSIVTNSVIAKIQSHLGTENNIPAWILLAAIAKYRELPNMNHHFQNYKEILCQNTFEANLVVEALRNSWSNLGDAFLQNFQSDLIQSLCKFQVNFSLVSICCDLFTDITKYLYPENGDQRVKLSALELMRLSEAQLEDFLEHGNRTEESLQMYLRSLATLGNASHLCTESLSSSTLRILQGLIVEWDSLPEAVRYLSELRAAAVAVLGQQAMRDREIAQEILPVLGYLMRATTTTSPNSIVEAAVKVNAAKALTDICIRFTALVEPYLPDMCVSMKDSNPIIREAVVVLFIQLLLEDFIKVKGPFFFHILTMLTDTDEMVRDLTVFLINERLLVKNKNLIARQFLDSVFHYNNYKLSTKFANTKVSQKEIAALTFPGQRNQSKRRLIFDFMAEHLDPPEKLHLIRRLTSEILSAVIGGTINVQKEEGLCVLQDCLYILSREQLHPASCTKRAEDDGQDENGLVEHLPTNNIANAIANSMKTYRIDILIPTLVKLKKILMKMGLPFSAHVTKYYLKIFVEYKKDQLTNLFSEHPDLEEEIETDLKKFGSNSCNADANDVEIFEDQSPAQTNLTVIKQNRTPRIVLRRISSLTYPGIISWRSPSQSSQSDGHSPLFGSSTNQTSISPNTHPEGNSPLSFEPGPSNSTPTTSKFRESKWSPSYSPIHTPNQCVTQSLRHRRRPIESEDEEVQASSALENFHTLRKRKAARKLRCETPHSEDSSAEINNAEARNSESENELIRDNLRPSI